MSRDDDHLKAEPCPRIFGECLVAGNAEEEARGRKIKRRAIAISVALQSAGLAALAIAPLFAKPAELTERITMPIPPYRHTVARRPSNATPPDRLSAKQCSFCPPRNIPPAIATVDRRVTQDQLSGPEDILIGTEGPERSGLLPTIDERLQPVVPPPSPIEKKRVVVGHIDPALLTHRVEPAYPALARQIRRSGKVELHAVIAADGSIQSLEVVNGDPLFVPSALEAVRQWHYKPTYLNGQPVEIDTYIMVIYTLQQ